MEDLTPEALQIGALRFSPHRYEESFDDGGLVIMAHIRVAGEQECQRLEELVSRRGYFQVVREGLSDEARDMRFGQVIWSRDDSEKKYQVHLVERVIDEREEKRFQGLGEPAASNVERYLARVLGVLDDLLRTLVEREVLTSAEREEIESRAKANVGSWRWAFFEVEDVDEW